MGWPVFHPRILGRLCAEQLSHSGKRQSNPACYAVVHKQPISREHTEHFLLTAAQCVTLPPSSGDTAAFTGASAPGWPASLAAPIFATLQDCADAFTISRSGEHAVAEPLTNQGSNWLLLSTTEFRCPELLHNPGGGPVILLVLREQDFPWPGQCKDP